MAHRLQVAGHMRARQMRSARKRVQSAGAILNPEKLRCGMEMPQQQRLKPKEAQIEIEAQIAEKMGKAPEM